MGALTPRRLTRAADPRTNYLLLAAYLWHPLPWMARVAAVNPATPPWARHIAAGQQRLLDITLSRTTSPQVLTRYAHDPGLTDSLLRRIVTNPHSDTAALAAVAAHRDVSINTLIAIITSDRCPAALAADIVMSLSDAHPDQRQRPRPDLWSLYLAATGRSDLPAPVLAWLARTCPHPAVLRNIATHPNTPRADAIMLALNEDTPIPA